jgi:hypothetical protein
MDDGSPATQPKEAPSAQPQQQPQQQQHGKFANVSNVRKFIGKEDRPLKKKEWSKAIQGKKEKESIELEAQKKAERIRKNSCLERFNQFACKVCDAKHFTDSQLRLHQELTQEEERHKTFHQKVLPHVVSTSSRHSSPMRTLTPAEKDAIERDLNSVCKAVQSSPDGIEFIAKSEWFTCARKCVKKKSNVCFSGSTHTLQAFGFQVACNSPQIHFERRCKDDEVLNRFCLATVSV